MLDEREPPERLWKFRPWNDHTRTLIVDGEAYFASLQDLNDPFEFRWCEQFPTTDEEIDRFVRELCARNFPNDTVDQRSINFHSIKAHVHDIADHHKNGIVPTLAKFEHGVFCLSEINSDILMWSHYAEHHKGICVSILPERMSIKRILPVEYCDEVPVIDAWQYIWHNAEMFVDLSRSKSTHWRYEKEWRTIHFIGPHRFPGVVDRIVIGACATPDTRAEVLDAVAAAKHPIQVLEAKLSDTHYKLHIRPLCV